MVAGGRHVWLLGGACMVAGGAWLLGGMHGCGGGVSRFARGHA